MLGFVLNVLIHGLNQKTIFIRIFRVLHTVQFSRNFVSLSLLFSAATRLFYHTVSGLSRTFLTFLKKFFLHKLKRRRRDLNPRAATNDLLPFQGSPFGQLGYFSIKNGEGGIRTHAPFRTNGFQDRLVMTTSIPLHNIFCCCRFVCLTRRLVYNTKPEYICQHFFQSFFIFFVFSL